MKKFLLLQFFSLVAINLALPFYVVAQDGTFNRAQQRTLMPPLVGKDVRDAERELKAIFKNIRVQKTEVENTQFQPGQVVEQSPLPQRPLTSETQVVLRYRKKPSFLDNIVQGISDNTRTVPGVRGKSVREAKQILENVQLKASFQSRQDNSDELIVIDQSPARGRTTFAGASVKLTVQRPSDSTLPVTPPRDPRPRPTPLTVPSVIGLTESQAIQKIEQAGWVVGTKTIEEAPTNHGRVLRQTPAPEIEVRQKSPISFVIAIKPPQVTVPNLKGQTLSQARQELESVGLKLGYSVGSPSLPRAVVSRQSPVPNAQVDRGSSVGLTFEIPPPPSPPPSPPTQKPVPNIVGRSRDVAAQILRNAGFRFVEGGTEPSDSVAGTVIRQNPQANTPALPGAEISGVVATPIVTITPSPPPQPTPVLVPDLRGLSREVASQNLLAVNLRIGPVTEAQSNSRPGTVLNQTPEPGTSVPPSSVVRIVLAVPTPTPVVDPKPPASPDDWLSKLIKDAPKALVVIGLGFFGLLLASLLKKLVRPKDEKDELLSLTAPIPEPSPSPALVKPNIEYRAQADTGTQSLETETRLSLPFEFTLRPLSDVGKQWIEVVGQLIANERSEA